MSESQKLHILVTFLKIDKCRNWPKQIQLIPQNLVYSTYSEPDPYQIKAPKTYTYGLRFEYTCNCLVHLTYALKSMVAPCSILGI